MIYILIGFLLGLILDTIWWKIDYNKYERGLEILEHYHIGFISIIIGGIISNEISYLFYALGMVLIYKESDQNNPFAHGSNHFKKSTIIGIGLFIVSIIWQLKTI